MTYYKVMWNEYAPDGVPIPRTLLYESRISQYLYLYNPCLKEWECTLYPTIHDVMRVVHCENVSAIDETFVEKVLEDIQMERMIKELTS